MRLVKFLSIVSLSLSTLTAMAQSSAVPLKEISNSTLLVVSGLSQTRLPVHKNFSCTQIYQNGHHVFTDCQDTDGYGVFSEKMDYGWQQAQPACAISIEEPIVRVEQDPSIFKSLLGSFLESDIKVDAGELIEVDGGLTSVSGDSVELEAKALDGNKVHIKCFNPNASNEDMEHELAGVLQFRSVVVKVHAEEASDPAATAAPAVPEVTESTVEKPSRASKVDTSDAPTERAVEAAEEESPKSSDAVSESSDSSEIPAVSEAHPADGKASYPAIDPADVQILEQKP